VVIAHDGRVIPAISTTTNDSMWRSVRQNWLRVRACAARPGTPWCFHLGSASIISRGFNFGYSILRVLCGPVSSNPKARLHAETEPEPVLHEAIR
jgi:hypothetical protein